MVGVGGTSRIGSTTRPDFAWISPPCSSLSSSSPTSYFAFLILSHVRSKTLRPWRPVHQHEHRRFFVVSSSRLCRALGLFAVRLLSLVPSAASLCNWRQSFDFDIKCCDIHTNNLRASTVAAPIPSPQAPRGPRTHRGVYSGTQAQHRSQSQADCLGTSGEAIRNRNLPRPLRLAEEAVYLEGLRRRRRNRSQLGYFRRLQALGTPRRAAGAVCLEA